MGGCTDALCLLERGPSRSVPGGERCAVMVQQFDAREGGERRRPMHRCVPVSGVGVPNCGIGTQIFGGRELWPEWADPEQAGKAGVCVEVVNGVWPPWELYLWVASGCRYGHSCLKVQVQAQP
jgi:hypothetical protein